MMMGCFACGLFFFRFWREAHDRLFLIFGIAFWIMAAERVFLQLNSLQDAETRAAIYLLRLAAFLLILLGIWDKNRGSRA